MLTHGISHVCELRNLVTYFCLNDRHYFNTDWHSQGSPLNKEKGFFLKNAGTRGHIYEDLRDTRATEDAGEAIAMENRKEVQSNQLNGSLDNV